MSARNKWLLIGLAVGIVLAIKFNRQIVGLVAQVPVVGRFLVT